MKTRVLFFTLIITVWCLGFVGCSEKSDEDLIRLVLEDMRDLAEERDIIGVMAFISEDYFDEDSRSINDIQALLEKNLNKYRGIDIQLLASRITVMGQTTASVETDIELSSGAAKLLRKMAGMASRCYRFRMEWTKEGENWKIKAASWEQIDKRDLLPESNEKKQD